MLVPADRVAANGDIAAAIGTYPLAAVAAAHGVPVIACVAASVVTPATPGRCGDRHRLPRRGGPRPRRQDRPRAAGHGDAGADHDITPAALVTTWLTAGGERTPPFGPPPGEDAPEAGAPDAVDGGRRGPAEDPA